MDYFYAYGEVKAIRKSDAKKCAFVTFASRSMAEETARAHAEAGLHIKNNKLRLMWGRPSTKGGAQGGKRQQNQREQQNPPSWQQQQQVASSSALPYPSMVSSVLKILCRCSLCSSLPPFLPPFDVDADKRNTLSLSLSFSLSLSLSPLPLKTGSKHDGVGAKAC